MRPFGDAGWVKRPIGFDVMDVEAHAEHAGEHDARDFLDGKVWLERIPLVFANLWRLVFRGQLRAVSRKVDD